MKIKILTGLLLAVVIAMAFSCNQRTEIKTEAPVVDKEKIKAEIQALENNFASIYDKRNADSITYYADDAVSYFAGREPIAGKPAIHKFIENEIKDYPKDAQISFQTLEVHVANDGQYVFEIGAFKQVDHAGKILHSGHYFSLFEKKNGKYYCIRDMSSSNPPVE